MKFPAYIKNVCDYWSQLSTCDALIGQTGSFEAYDVCAIDYGEDPDGNRIPMQFWTPSTLHAHLTDTMNSEMRKRTVVPDLYIDNTYSPVLLFMHRGARTAKKEETRAPAESAPIESVDPESPAPEPASAEPVDPESASAESPAAEPASELTATEAGGETKDAPVVKDRRWQCRFMRKHTFKLNDPEPALPALSGRELLAFLAPVWRQYAVVWDDCAVIQRRRMQHDPLPALEWRLGSGTQPGTLSKFSSCGALLTALEKCLHDRGLLDGVLETYTVELPALSLSIPGVATVAWAVKSKY